MKTIKIKRNVIHKAAILKKDAVHKLPDGEADQLISGEHAEVFDGKAPSAPQPPAGVSDAPSGKVKGGKKNAGDGADAAAAGTGDAEPPKS